jgi:hypothetical protein
MPVTKRPYPLVRVERGFRISFDSVAFDRAHARFGYCDLLALRGLRPAPAIGEQSMQLSIIVNT